MPSLRQLEYLVALAQELHFRRAAERVNVTQPTLSAQLQQLEKRLKVPLIERGAGGVMLTPLGREVAARARIILAQVQDIRDLASSSQHGFEGTVRLGVPPTLGPYLLPHIVPRLHGAYPDMKLYVREEKPGALINELLAGGHDIVIVPMPVVRSDVTVEPLFREPLRLVCAPDHRLVGHDTISRSDLAGENVLAMESGHHLHDQVSRICEDFGAVLLRDYEGTSLDTLRLMVGMGVGIAFLPALYVRTEIGNREEITVLDLNMPSLQRQVALVWRQSAVHSNLFGDLAAMIRTIAKEELAELTVTDR
ncbi:MAG: hydrogen peroxide-inducible genes activator [Ahrensia sp.]|nr:hydrogen peroxide-inducible genes activator [Ahrensia sp.]